MSLKPGTTLGHYVIAETAGHGGMSTVYRARQASLQRDVAIKVLPDFFVDRATREGARVDGAPQVTKCGNGTATGHRGILPQAPGLRPQASATFRRPEA